MRISMIFTTKELVRTLLSAWGVAFRPLRWSRFRWLATGWVVTTIFLAIGGEYAIGGRHIVASTGSYAMFVHAFPLGVGVRGHGIAMFGIGIALAYQLSGGRTDSDAGWRVLKRTLLVAAGYFLWTAVLFALAGLEPGGRVSWIGVTLWTILAAFPVILSFAPPPRLVTAHQTALVELCIEHGASTEQARGIAEDYFSGATHEHH